VLINIIPMLKNNNWNKNSKANINQVNILAFWIWITLHNLKTINGTSWALTNNCVMLAHANIIFEFHVLTVIDRIKFK